MIDQLLNQSMRPPFQPCALTALPCSSGSELPVALQRRAREYLHAQRDCQVRFETSKAVSALSPSLQVEMIMEVQRVFFECVAFFKNVEPPCCVQLSMAMRSGVFAPGELASTHQLYVIDRGLALYHGRILSWGKTWGEDDVLLTDGLLTYLRTARARAMTYLEYRSLSRDALHEIVDQFPSTRKKLRRSAIFVALARCMVAKAAAKREEASVFDTGAKKNVMYLNRVQSAADEESSRILEKAQAVDKVSELLGRKHGKSMTEEKVSKGAAGKESDALKGLVNTEKAIEHRLDDLDERHMQAQRMAEERHLDVCGRISALLAAVEGLQSRTPMGANAARDASNLPRVVPPAGGPSETQRNAPERHVPDPKSDPPAPVGQLSAPSTTSCQPTIATHSPPASSEKRRRAA